MKKIKILIVILIAAVSFNSCEKDELVFTAMEPSTDFVFLNTFLEEYTITNGASANIGERFTWSPVNFEVQTPVSYDLESSLSSDFSDPMVVSSTTTTNAAVTVGQLLSMAQELGLDNDPSTDLPNTGTVYFRVKAYIGNDGMATYSPVQSLNILWEETAPAGSGIMLSDWGVVGSAYNDWGGAGPDGNFYTTDDSNVIVSYVTLLDGAMKFRLNNDWGTNYGDDGADGVLEQNGADINVTAGTYKITVNTSDLTYTMEPFSYGVVGSAYNDWGGAGPDAKLYYDYTTDTWKVGVRLMDGAMKIRLNNAWDVNFGDSGADGTLDAGGDDINVTAGHYLLTVNLNDNTYTLEPADIWGVVGSAYNDWGGAGPDFALTPIGEDMLVGDVVDLVDGAMKFRVNNDWTVNYGDTGADGTLDEGGDDITVTGGKYRVRVNLADNTYNLYKIQ